MFERSATEEAIAIRQCTQWPAACPTLLSLGELIVNESTLGCPTFAADARSSARLITCGEQRVGL